MILPHDSVIILKIKEPHCKEGDFKPIQVDILKVKRDFTSKFNKHICTYASTIKMKLKGRRTWNDNACRDLDMSKLK